MADDRRDVDENSARTVKSADRVLAILEYLAKEGQASFGAIVRDLGLPLSSAHQLLQTILSRGFIELDPSTRPTGLPWAPALVTPTALVGSSPTPLSESPEIRLGLFMCKKRHKSSQAMGLLPTDPPGTVTKLALARHLRAHPVLEVFDGFL